MTDTILWKATCRGYSSCATTQRPRNTDLFVEPVRDLGGRDLLVVVDYEGVRGLAGRAEVLLPKFSPEGQRFPVEAPDARVIVGLAAAGGVPGNQVVLFAVPRMAEPEPPPPPPPECIAAEAPSDNQGEERPEVSE